MDAIETTVDEAVDEAEASIREALGAEGFDPHLFTEFGDERAAVEELRALTDDAAGRLRRAVASLRA